MQAKTCPDSPIVNCIIALRKSAQCSNSKAMRCVTLSEYPVYVRYTVHYTQHNHNHNHTTTHEAERKSLRPHTGPIPEPRRRVISLRRPPPPPPPLP